MNPEKVEISTELMFEIMEHLRIAPLYITEEAQPEDFKPHKWEPYRVETAKNIVATYRKLLAEMETALSNARD